MELEQLRIKDFLDKKSKGALTVTKFQQRLNHTLQPVALASAAEGVVTYGDALLLYNVKVCLSVRCVLFL